MVSAVIINLHTVPMPIRVVVIDDSLTMRSVISQILNADPEIEVVGVARDPYEGREAIKTLNPDVVTLDIEMPRMNGIEFLEKIMRLRPMPVVMVSTLTQAGADATLQALSIGAVDYATKPTNGDMSSLKLELPGIVRSAAMAKVRIVQQKSGPTVMNSVASSYEPHGKYICIGSSTGGVEALSTLLSSFPENCPPTVIVQHMPRHFTASFAARLDRTCKPVVREAKEGDYLEVGQILIAPGDDAHLMISGMSKPKCVFQQEPSKVLHRPSVDILFQSAAQMLKREAIGVILTGMGKDGAAGLLEMKNAGAFTVGQDEASSLIYGMPKAAYEAGGVIRQAPLSKIAHIILNDLGSYH